MIKFTLVREGLMENDFTASSWSTESQRSYYLPHHLVIVWPNDIYFYFFSLVYVFLDEVMSVWLLSVSYLIIFSVSLKEVMQYDIPVFEWMSSYCYWKVSEPYFSFDGLNLFLLESFSFCFPSLSNFSPLSYFVLW